MRVQQVHHPLRPTQVSIKTIRARLSLRETQVQFAQRFHVAPITVHKWESGKVLSLRPIYQVLMNALEARLRAEGRWLSDDIFAAIYHKELEIKGNALH